MNDYKIIYDAIKSRFGEFTPPSNEDVQLVLDYSENGFQTNSKYSSYYLDGKDLHICTISNKILTPEASYKFLITYHDEADEYEIYECIDFTNAKEYSYDSEGNVQDYIVTYSTKLHIYTGAFKKL